LSPFGLSPFRQGYFVAVLNIPRSEERHRTEAFQYQQRRMFLRRVIRPSAGQYRDNMHGLRVNIKRAHCSLAVTERWTAMCCQHRLLWEVDVQVHDMCWIYVYINGNLLRGCQCQWIDYHTP